MDPSTRNLESAETTHGTALADFARLALELSRARAVRLETEEGSLALGAPETESSDVIPLAVHGRLLVFGRTSAVDLDPLVRRIVAYLDGRRASFAHDGEHALAHALANAARANEIARSAARRFEALFEGLPVACYACDAEGRLVEWNRAAEEIWGAAIAMAWGRDVASVVDPDNPEAERAVLARALAGETVGNEEREVRVGKDGLRWHLVSMFPLRDEAETVVGAIGARLDVTRRRTAQRDLAEREKRFRTVLEALHEGLTVVDEFGNLVMRNPSAERILRLTSGSVDLSDEFPSGTVVDSDGRPMAPDEWPLSIALGTGRPARNVMLGLTRPAIEGRIWISVNAEPLLLPDSDDPIGAVATFTDVTERVEQNRLLAEYAARLAEHDRAA